MNTKHLIIEAVLAVAVIALFILFFSCPCDKKKQQCEVVLPEGTLAIATINNDSLLAHYQFAIEAKDRLMSKQEDATVKLDAQAKAFQKEYENFMKEAADFQKKVEANAFLSRERAESEQNRLQNKQAQLAKREQDIQDMQNKLQNDYMEELGMLNKQLNDTLDAFIEQYNADGKYQLILNSMVVIDQKEAIVDITDEVVEQLNARYEKK